MMMLTFKRLRLAGFVATARPQLQSISSKSFLHSNNTMGRVVCVFGSSSPNTPQQYLDVSYRLGELLALGGHLNVNGGGMYGCMGALNRGTKAHKGRIRGVIHSKFVVDKKEDNEIEDLMVATGNNLSQRKRALVEGADCIITLPGGPGTWDELFEVAVERAVGFSHQPLCLINVDGYYNGIIEQMERAQKEQFLYSPWRDMVHVVETAEEALEWCLAMLELRDEGKLELVQPIERAPPTYMPVLTSFSNYLPFWGVFLSGAVAGAAAAAFLIQRAQKSG